MESTYRLVGTDEIDLPRRFISIASPVGQALVGKREGDTATVMRPKGPTEGHGGGHPLRPPGGRHAALPPAEAPALRRRRRRSPRRRRRRQRSRRRRRSRAQPHPARTSPPSPSGEGPPPALVPRAPSSRRRHAKTQQTGVSGEVYPPRGGSAAGRGGGPPLQGKVPSAARRMGRALPAVARLRRVERPPQRLRREKASNWRTSDAARKPVLRMSFKSANDGSPG